MNEHVIAFLVQYQQMRGEQINYFKTKDKGSLIRAKQLELALDKNAFELLAVLNPEKDEKP